MSAVAALLAAARHNVGLVGIIPAALAFKVFGLPGETVSDVTLG
jgi:hypothetical protein